MMDTKQNDTKQSGTEDERAVSPVISVVLMVVITVILAAAAASLALNTAEDQSAPATAGVSIENETGTPGLQVTLTALGDKTNAVECVGPSTPKETASSIGTTFNCSAGNTIVAVDTDGKQTTIRSDIDT
ncbi:type IV pilin [Natrinema halophilum]|uniref:Type IV pilin n=1 Tax=Natrinema halophilum TaxID=1699371 RepID=A0A7D5K7J3_9EURY|nr:type IV pilin [Natrinema halophilum]QLG50043.1 type IV pilin N-terminal domain-containing protein [Natrinema halophilum]